MFPLFVSKQMYLVIPENNIENTLKDLYHYKYHNPYVYALFQRFL